MLRVGQFTPQLKLLYHMDKVQKWKHGMNISPVIVEFDLSNRCNHKCDFCTFKYIKDRSIIDKEVAKSTLRELSGLGVKAVNWTGGGEPLTHTDFVEITEYANMLGIKQGLFTNGSLMNSKIKSSLCKTHEWVRFSIDAGTKETYLKTKGVDDFDKVIENVIQMVWMRKALRKKIDIGIGFVITPDNYHEIHKFVELIDKTGADYGQFKPCINDHTKNWQHEAEWWSQKVIPILEYFSKDNEKVVVNSYKFQELLNKDKSRTYKKCYGHIFCPCIGATGDVWLCTHMRDIQGFSMGNLNEMKFSDIWNSQKRKDVIEGIDFSKCQFCCKNHEINKALYSIKHVDTQHHGEFL